MLVTFTLPNKKKVVVEAFLYKHIREFLLQNNCLESKLKFLERFIVTKKLNVIEKFITLLKLREKCIKSTLTLAVDKSNKEVGLDYILESFDEYVDIRQEVTCNNIHLILDYPTKFCVNTDNALSVIREIKIEDEHIVTDDLSDEEFLQVINMLPADVLNVVGDFIDDKKDAFVFPLLHSRNNSIKINFLNSTPFDFINTIYECIDENNYREYIFVLSKRIKDVEFLVNSTMVDIYDYLDLYKRECEEEKDKLQK